MVGRGFNGEELGTNFLEGVTVVSSSGPTWPLSNCYLLRALYLKVLLGFRSRAFKVDEFLEVLLNGGLGGWLRRCSEVPGGGPQPGLGYFIAIALMTP